jgi:hypothetical protein
LRNTGQPIPGRERGSIANVKEPRGLARNLVPQWAIAPLNAIRARFVLKVLHCFYTDRVNPKFLDPEPYDARFLSATMVREFAKDSELDMAPEFVADALAKGDVCLGILDGDTLAAYTWYSSRPTRIVPPDLLLYFDEETYFYMYKAFTRLRYRGQRLHAIGKTMALQGYLAQGFRGLLSYVEFLNFASLKSVKRMGGRQFGSIYIVGAFGRYLIFRSRGCRRFGFRLEKLPAFTVVPAPVPSLTTQESVARGVDRP